MPHDDPATPRRPWIKRAWYGLTQVVVRTAARFYFPLRWVDHRRVPMSGPAVFVANHASHLDPLLIGVVCPRQICYFARESLFHGALGWLIRSYDAIPVDRDGGGLAGIRETLRRIKQGNAVLVFPEGTRTPDGRLQPMQPGVIALLRRGRAALVPVGIAGTFAAMPRGVTRPRRRPLGIAFGEPVANERLAGLTDEALLALIGDEIAAALGAAERLLPASARQAPSSRSQVELGRSGSSAAECPSDVGA